MTLETRHVLPCQPERSELEPGVLYISGGPWCVVDYPHVTLLCPCGCGLVTWVGDCPESAPTQRWSIERHEDGTVTVSPSIAVRGGCRAHYWIRRSRVVWCGSRP